MYLYTNLLADSDNKYKGGKLFIHLCSHRHGRRALKTFNKGMLEILDIVDGLSSTEIIYHEIYVMLDNKILKI